MRRESVEPSDMPAKTTNGLNTIVARACDVTDILLSGQYLQAITSHYTNECFRTGNQIDTEHMRT